MNGVRRFLAGGAAPKSSPPSSPETPPQPMQPLVASARPSWPPQPASPGTQPDSPLASPKNTTAALFLRKDKQRPPPPDDEPGNSSLQSARSSSASVMSPARSQKSLRTSSPARPPLAGPSSPSRNRVLPPVPSPGLATRKSVSQADADWTRAVGPHNTRDELLISLLASEALVDSREFRILSSEEVDDLKKEQQVLASRLEAMGKKLSLETKIRDAAVSLAKVNAAHKTVSKASSEQLDAANRRVDAAQKEFWRVSDRLNEVQKRLLEHRAGVLSFSVRSMEKKIARAASTNGDDSGYNTPNLSTPMSPTASSMTSASTSSKARFDGAHLFAGHADATVPRARDLPAGAAEVAALEEKLKAATDALTAAGQKQAEMVRELSHLRLEKQEVETMLGMDLQSAEETIAALERELPRLESQDAQLRQLQAERGAWEQDRMLLEQRTREVERLEKRVEELETKKGEAAGAEGLLAAVRASHQEQLDQKEAEIREFKAQWEAERAAWERDKAVLEDEKMEDLVRLQEEMDRLREDDRAALQKATEELDEGHATLRTLIQAHGVLLYSRDSSLVGLLSSVGTHLETVNSRLDTLTKAQGEWDVQRRKLEEDLRVGLDKREALVQEIENARREREEARREVKSLESVAKDEASRFSSPKTMITSVDNEKIISVLQPIWAILPSPETRAAKFATGQRQFRTGSPTPGSPVASLSELDVRSLKTLYDARAPPPPGVPAGAFSLEAFAARVQALIADDRALIERLVRFAQAHDLLKKNAERAQKLAQESSVALETYQKQVQMLEERSMGLLARHAAMQDEVQNLQDAVDRITAEKRDVEMQAAEQAETCRQLTEANNTLSARTLTLAEEAASAPEMVKKQLEGQLAECRVALQKAQEELDAMRSSEQSQRIALLDELNSMQTENGQLRAQLRAVKK